MFSKSATFIKWLNVCHLVVVPDYQSTRSRVGIFFFFFGYQEASQFLASLVNLITLLVLRLKCNMSILQQFGCLVWYSVKISSFGKCNTDELIKECWLDSSDIFSNFLYQVLCHEFGPTVSFNLKRSDGSWYGYREVEKLVSLSRIQLRVNCDVLLALLLFLNIYSWISIWFFFEKKNGLLNEVTRWD